MTREEGITQERIRKLFRYSPVVGVFEKIVGSGRKGHPKRWVLAGACNPATGYIYINFDNKKVPAHRMAWLYMYGSLPDGQIDHIDGDRSNNAITNLRVVTPAENSWNCPNRRSNKSGVKGVSWDRAAGMWVARVKAHGQIAFNAYFKTIDEAKVAIEAEREKAHGEYANHGIHKYVLEEMLDGV